jgi:hypothetical protein
MVSVLVSCFLPFLWYLYSCRVFYLSYGICTRVVLFTFLMVSVLVSCFLLFLWYLYLCRVFTVLMVSVLVSCFFQVIQV